MMNNRVRCLSTYLYLLAGFMAAGCRSPLNPVASEASLVPAAATDIEYPDVREVHTSNRAANALAPRTIDDAPPTEFREITLSEAIQTALAQSDILKDNGGRILTSPDTARSIYDPAIRESNPQFGVEGALSAFDTQFSSGLFWSRNDRAVNNILLGGGVREIKQDLGNFNAGLTKTTATGTQFSVNNSTQYDQNNQPGNLFTSVWDTQFSASLRHPFLQGGGTEFNRIAGPNAQPGFNFANGVLIARTNTDISIADFEGSVRDFVSEVEDAYWDLYFAYRELDAKMQAKNQAEETWRKVSAQKGLPGGSAEREARARAQFFRFQDLVQNALNGVATGGRSVGIYNGERRLRRLMGMPSNDGLLLRPAEEPAEAPVAFDWSPALYEALDRRVELRRQQWKIKRRELELIASRNFLLPRVDGVAQYNFRGFGDNLTGDGGGRFGSAFKDLESGEHQEWQLGFEVSMPLGRRQAWAGVRHAEHNLARERALLREQEHLISHDLADAIAEASRAHAAIRTNYNRLDAATQRLAAAREVAKVDRVSVDLVLEAQEDIADAQSRYFESRRDYAKALKNVHFQKGSLLQFHGIGLAESGWHRKAYSDARETAQRWRQKHIDYTFDYPRPISRGPVAQQYEAASAPVIETDLPPGAVFDETFEPGAIFDYNQDAPPGLELKGEEIFIEPQPADSVSESPR